MQNWTQSIHCQIKLVHFHRQIVRFLVQCQIVRFLYLIFSILLISALVGFGPFKFLPTNSFSAETQSWLNYETHVIFPKASNLDPDVLKLGLKAYSRARQYGMTNKGLLTIIDYSKPSVERRLWVVDLIHQRVLFNTWVCHGLYSGSNKAYSFSNQPGSLKSVYGVLLTDGDPYEGNNGYSLRLFGLEPGINDNAYRRDIVFHGASYVSAEVARFYGKLGRSWGCPAVNEKLAKPIIDTIKGNTLVFVYYPDHRWLWNSSFLTG